MRKLSFIIAAVAALILTGPAHAAASAPEGTVQTQQTSQKQAQEAEEFSAQRYRHHGHRHWRGDRYWRGGSRRWAPPYRGPLCRMVWSRHRGWVRVCRW